MDYRDALWRAANKLRGHLDAAAYRPVVLALLTLRFVEAGRGALRAPDGFALRPGRLDEAAAAVERANPALAGVLARGLDDVPRAGEILALLRDVPFADGRDEIGNVCAWFLGRFARLEGRRGGQFYTPGCVVRLLADTIGPLRGRVYDPCCGAGGMFIESAGADACFGQESNPQTWRLARLNLALHGVAADLGPRPADTFHDDLHAERAADFVLANPPFNQSEWGADRLADDPRWRFGRPPRRNADFAWLQHVIAHLAPDGVAAVVLANASLAGAQPRVRACRAALVDAGWVDAIVTLPAQLFHATPIPVSVWILSRARPDTTLLVDARALGRRVDRTHCELDAAARERIAACYRAYRDGAQTDEPGFAAVASRARIAAERHALLPARFVGSPAAIPAAPATLAQLHAEWRALADEADALAREIRELDLGV